MNNDTYLNRLKEGVIDRISSARNEEIFVYFGRKKIKNERWIMAFQDRLIDIAKDTEIDPVDKNLLMYFFGKLDWENYLQVTQDEIAKDLKMRQPNVARSIKALINRGYIEKRKIGRNNVYRISKDFVWKGKVSLRSKVVPFPSPGQPV